jgi:hypothetical protein
MLPDRRPGIGRFRPAQINIPLILNQINEPPVLSVSDLGQDRAGIMRRARLTRLKRYSQTAV